MRSSPALNGFRGLETSRKVILLNAKYSSIDFLLQIQTVGQFSLTPESKTFLEVHYSGLTFLGFNIHIQISMVFV